MSKKITLIDPEFCGTSISSQLRIEGAKISDSWFKEYSDDIWEEFKLGAPEAYRLTRCDESEEGDECGLCGHDIATSYEIVAIREPLVFNHPELDMVIEWPERIVVGSSCVKLLNFDSYLTKFVESCFDGYCPGYDISENGLVGIEKILEHSDKWKYDTLILPHSVFTLVPASAMRTLNLYVSELKTPFDAKRKKEKTLLRSFNSKRGKWKEKSLVEPSDELCSSKEPQNTLATVLTREEASLLTEIINKKDK